MLKENMELHMHISFRESVVRSEEEFCCHKKSNIITISYHITLNASKENSVRNPFHNTYDLYEYLDHNFQVYFNCEELSCCNSIASYSWKNLENYQGPNVLTFSQ